MSLLRQGLLGAKTFLELAAKKVEEAEAQQIENKITGGADTEKVMAILNGFRADLNNVRAAVEQLQQRVSNIESLQSRLEARLPPPPPAMPMGGAGGWNPGG